MAAETPDSVSDAPELHLLCIGLDAQTSGLVTRVMAGGVDRVTFAVGVEDGLERASGDPPDVVLVFVGGAQGGLAITHHIGLGVPDARVYVVAHAQGLELAAQALGLGAQGLLMLPLSGDELMTVMSVARSRRVEEASRVALNARFQEHWARLELVSTVARMEGAAHRGEAGERWLSALADAGLLDAAALYVPVADGERQLVRIAARGELASAPSFCEEIDLERLAEAAEMECLTLRFRERFEGLLVVSPGAGVPRAAWASREAEIASSLAAACLATVSAAERATGAALKDPRSSAYSFAYFVDVAGREIDKALRHNRRFALATLSLEGAASDGDVIQAIERILSVVRDTDVVARVDERELYLLLPETGGIGAHSCRRRVMRKLESGGDWSPGGGGVLVGVAAFPHDGTALSQLLEVAKHRAELSRRSSVRSLKLKGASLPALADLLLGAPPRASLEATVEGVHTIELPTIDALSLALSVVQQAQRGGASRILCGLGEGLSLGAVARAAVGRDTGDVRLDSIDMKLLPGCSHLELLCLVAEHGSYTLLGRSDHGIVRAVHSADPLLVDHVVGCLHEATGKRLFD
jgi:GGDEF domain-containing protein/ActR/RegA family two-component response regulator